MAFDYDNYYRLDYIRGTGTQYISTPYYANNNTRAVLKGSGYVYTGSGRGILGARNDLRNKDFTVYQMASDSSPANVIRFGYNTAVNNTSVNGHSIEGYPFIFDLNQNVHYLQYGSSQTTVSTSFSTGTFTCDYPFTIWAFSNNGSVNVCATMNVHQCTLYDNKILVHNYLPAERKSDGVYGLYDTVTSDFLTNAGTGTFIAGDRIEQGFDNEHYYELNSLRSSGTQYIDTLYVANSNTKVVINDFTPLYSVQWEEYLGCNTADDGGNSFEFRRNYNTSQVLFRIGSTASSSVAVSSSDKHKVTLEYTGITVDGTKYTIAGGNISTNTLYLFAAHIDTGVFRASHCIMNAVEIYENDTLVHNYVPAERIVDGAKGMYDTIDGIFCGNIGTGNFWGLAKPIHDCNINDFDRVNYLIANGTQYICTDYNPKVNSRIFAGIYMTATAGGVIIGGAPDNNDNKDYRFFNASNQAYLDIGANRTNGGSIANNTFYDIEIGNFYVRAKGLTQTSRAESTETLENFTVNIFSYGLPTSTTMASGWIYYLKIFEYDSSTSSNVLFRDMIPVKKKSNGLLGMFDLVTNTFYTNSGTGLFTYGSVRNDYYLLKDLQSSGTQYVLLNYASYEGIVMDAKASFPSLSSQTQIVFGNTSSSGRQYLGVRDTKLSFGVGSNERLIDYTFSENTDYTFRGVYNKGSTSAKVNGTTLYTGTDSPTYLANSFYAFATDNNNSATNLSTLKLYYLNIISRGLTVRNYVPAERSSDGVYGLYDTFTRMFYINNGTGTFATTGRVEYDLTIHATAGGTTTGGGTYSKVIGQDTEFTVTATANEGFDFVGWYSDSSYQNLLTANSTYSGTINANMDLYALFSARVVITINYDSRLGSASYQWINANQISLTATPNKYGTFSGWYINNVLLSTSNPYTYTATQDITIEARFSVAYDWIDPIVDRTQADITAKNSKAYINATDLNRIEKDTIYLCYLLHEEYPALDNLIVKTNWVRTDIPSVNNMERIRSNAETILRTLHPTDSIQTFGNQFNFENANGIEDALLTIYEEVNNA